MNCLKVSLRAKQGANASQKSLLNIGYSRTVEKLDSSIIFQPFSLSSEMQTILFGSGALQIECIIPPLGGIHKPR